MKVLSEIQLVEDFVSELLNGYNTSAIDRIFHPLFRDWDPIVIPREPPTRVGDVAYVRRLIQFLSLDSVDIMFTLEDLFSADGKIGYRLFGEGAITLESPSASDRLGAENIMRDPGLSDANAFSPIAISSVSDARRAADARRSGAILGNKLHIEYQSVGIFYIENDRIRGRRGTVIVR